MKIKEAVQKACESGVTIYETSKIFTDTYRKFHSACYAVALKHSHTQLKEVIQTPVQAKMSLLEIERWKLPKAALD